METLSTSGIDKDSDATLLSAAKRGDAHAFEKLALRHKRRVLAVAQRITNNRKDAEDVLQESFYSAFVHLGDFQKIVLFHLVDTHHGESSLDGAAPKAEDCGSVARNL